MTTEGTAAGRPVSGSEWARSAFSGGWDKRGDTRWLYAVFFLLTMAQSLPLTAIQVVLNRDLGLQERPEALNRFFAVEFSMSMLKPIYAAVSDLLPIARRRRVPYMMIGGVMYAVMLQAYASVRTIGQLYAAGVCSVIFYAICETGADGLPSKITGLQVRNELREFDAVVCACDLPGVKKVLPKPFRQFPAFDNIYELDAVPIATVQLRFDGWVTEMNDEKRMMDISGDQSDGRGAGIDNLLYSADAEFSCFADLAVTSPGEYYKEGEGSLIQAVFDERAVKRSEEQLVADCISQLNDLFPSSKKLTCTWSKVTKLGQSLYRENPGMDKFRPTQATPIDNFFLAGSYTYQDYIDSMEGATKSGLMVADEIIARADRLADLAKEPKPEAAAVA